MFVLHVQLCAPRAALHNANSESTSHMPDCIQINHYFNMILKFKTLKRQTLNMMHMGLF